MTLSGQSPRTPPGPHLPLPPRRPPGSILFVIFNLVAMSGLLGMAAFMVITALVQMTAYLPGVPNLGSPLSNFLLAGGLTFSGLMLIPSAIQSFKAVNGKPDRPATLPPLRLGTFLIIMAVWIVVAIIAQVFGGMPFSWIFLPPLVIAGMFLPVYLLFRLGTAGISLGSLRRAWSVFGLGLVAGPALASVMEVAAYLLLLLGGGLILALKPDWQAIYARVAAQLQQASSTDQILTILGPFLMNPLVIVLLLLVVSLFIPLVEELAKPVGLWMLRKRPPTPREGFALGVISGAGFALLESLLASASTDGAWGLAFVARVGGGVMHSLNTGLMGWAIASFWQERHFGKLVRTYGLVVLLHGLWNALTIGTILGGLRVLSSPEQMDLLGGGLVTISIFGLLILAFGGLTFLIVLNRRMRSVSAVETPVEKIPPDSS